MGHARALLGLDADRQYDAAKQVVRQGLSVRQTEAMVRRMQRPETRALRREDPDTRRLERELAEKEGIFAGISSGATLATALDVAESAEDGSVILAMLPDTGERYLSTPLFEGVNEGSDDDWLDSL